MVLKRTGRTFKKKIVLPRGEILKQTREFIITAIQREAYPLEIQRLQEHKSLPKGSPLIRLNPYLDKCEWVDVSTEVTYQRR